MAVNREQNPAAGGDSVGSAPMMLTANNWPAHTSRTVPWVRRGAARGPKADRMLKEIDVSIPPHIAELNYTPSSDTATELEKAIREIVLTDADSDSQLSSLGRFLIRTESVASSKIEQIEASLDDYARAMAGIKSNESAVSMVKSAQALHDLVEAAGSGQIELDAILAAHRKLMEDDVEDRAYAGRLRDMQNWIGGSDYTPRGAVHIPPPPETVPGYMDDLIAFANRDDVPTVAQAAIVHAQFESIHPFTDGNGRIGRALINAVLRRRKLTTGTVVPIASAMVANRDNYFDLVNNYRTGALEPFVLDVAHSSQVASREARASAAVLEALPAQWASISNPRSGSAAAAIIGMLLDHPVFSAEDVELLLPDAQTSAIYKALTRLEKDGVIHEVTARKRDRVWSATLVMDELDDLADRIAQHI
ncbi:Fic family protein [Rhodoglobus aureus]|uniref:Fic family protein n=1 Tax=Rhodoglobus aureus TaxID=191497 RepID=A0ABP4G4W7_9MICO